MLFLKQLRAYHGPHFTSPQIKAIDLVDQTWHSWLHVINPIYARASSCLESVIGAVRRNADVIVNIRVHNLCSMLQVTQTHARSKRALANNGRRRDQVQVSSANLFVECTRSRCPRAHQRRTHPASSITCNNQIMCVRGRRRRRHVDQKQQTITTRNRFPANSTCRHVRRRSHPILFHTY